MSFTKEQRGSAITEFAIVLPLLLGFALAGLELSRSLRYTQLASTLSREIGSVAYRECTSMSARDTRTCLQGVYDRFITFGQSLVPGTLLAVSAYEYDKDTGEIRRVGIAPLAAATPGATDNPSRFTVPNGVPINGVAGSLTGNAIAGAITQQVLQDHRVVVIGEALVPFRPIVGSVPGVLTLFGGGFYDYAIL